MLKPRLLCMSHTSQSVHGWQGRVSASIVDRALECCHFRSIIAFMVRETCCRDYIAFVRVVFEQDCLNNGICQLELDQTARPSNWNKVKLKYESRYSSRASTVMLVFLPEMNL
jgi:hypothetical protein